MIKFKKQKPFCNAINCFSCTELLDLRKQVIKHSLTTSKASEVMQCGRIIIIKTGKYKHYMAAILKVFSFSWFNYNDKQNQTFTYSYFGYSNYCLRHCYSKFQKS